MITSFYENNYKDYFRSTVAVDPAPFLTQFASMLSSGATILDIGCGSGRDLRWLADKGFKTTGFELSPGLAKLARDYAKRHVIEADFTLFDFSTLSFDAILLIGSLVHVEHIRFTDVLQGICQALKKNGIVLLSLKEGSGYSYAGDGRIFTLWQRDQIDNILWKNGLTILNFSHHNSALPTDDIWLTYLLQKAGK